MVIFNKTTRGFHHIEKERVCEDFSGSFSEENGRYHIIAVADGHGDNACFRSHIGSEKAVDAAIKCLKTFADSFLEETEYYSDLDRKPRFRNTVIKNLTDSVIVEWYNEIEEYNKKNPITEDEAGEYFEKIRADDKLDLHVYGTTLIAALWIDNYLIIIQQGDGRCVVFYEDGTFDQPVPWDDLCSGNITTSMCESDAPTRIRSCILNIIEKKVIACVMGSDGVEDAYADTYEAIEGLHTLMGGVYTFYKHLLFKLCELSDDSIDRFDNYLSSMLSEFSKSGLFSAGGSGDDVSVAGIVDLEAVKKHKDCFRKEIDLYDLENQLFIQRAELNGKVRKHDILKKKLEESEKRLSEFENKGEAAEAEEDDTLGVDHKTAKDVYEKAYTEFEKYDEIFKKIEKGIKETERKIEKEKICTENDDGTDV